MLATILIVDDEAANRQVLINHLTTAGFNIAQAHDGQSALDSIAKNKPDLVLLDIMMPNMSGIEVCETLRTKFTSADYC